MSHASKCRFIEDLDNLINLGAEFTNDMKEHLTFCEIREKYQEFQKEYEDFLDTWGPEDRE